MLKTQRELSKRGELTQATKSYQIEMIEMRLANCLLFAVLKLAIVLKSSKRAASGNEGEV